MSHTPSAPLVSVVIPVYNRIAYLDDTIQSVLGQTYPHWEITIVDDGSEEETSQALQRYASERITIIRQPNQGNAVARNTGIREARGRYIICLDSDDLWHPDMLRECVAVLESHPDADVVYTQFRIMDAEGQVVPIPPAPEPKEGDLLESLLMGFPILPSSALIRRRCFERWGMFTPGLDDWEMWLRWAAHGCRFKCIARPRVLYRIHDRNFHLDWAKRRKIHFATLDTFYRQPNLPATAIRRRDEAYANQHFYFAVLAWRVNRPDDALAEFVRAIRANPRYLRDLDFYTRIACAHQSRIDEGSARNLNLDVAERTVIRSLDALFSAGDLPVAVRDQRASAYGWAYLALARLAYSVLQDMASTRRFLLSGLAAWPPVLWHTDWVLWLVRAILGRRHIQRLKRLARIYPTETRYAES
ncbi:MAG: glycosyltransferase [Chloroflexi bacterium]|nr:glycosyltransferase [Chloroflexota bacterium]